MIVSTATWPAPTATTWRPAREEDGPALTELRAQVLRDSLERVGRYDEVRVRERFLVGFDPTHTHVLVGAEPLGSIALRPEPEGSWLEHFYLSPALQGAGVGGGVLRAVVAAADRTSRVLWLDVLQRSDARRLYERHGFVLDHEDPVDVFLRRDPR